MHIFLREQSQWIIEDIICEQVGLPEGRNITPAPEANNFYYYKYIRLRSHFHNALTLNTVLSRLIRVNTLSKHSGDFSGPLMLLLARGRMFIEGSRIAQSPSLHQRE